MTNEELVKAYQAGDNKALETIIEQNKGLVYKLASRFKTDRTASIDLEDLVQEGMMGLIIAAKRYDSELEGKASFNTYAVYWIRQKISRFISRRNTNEEVSLNEPFGEDGLERGDLIADTKDYFCEKSESVWHRELAESLRQAMLDNLSLRQREVLELRYGFDNKRGIPIKDSYKKYGDYSVCSFNEVAELFSISKVRARQIEVSALARLRSSKWGESKCREKEEEHQKKPTTDTFFDNIFQSIQDLERAN